MMADGQMDQRESGSTRERSWQPAGRGHYLLPSHPGEVDRLDLQHYALRMALGANHQAPVTAPGRILDVGSGTGQWGWDLTEEFGDAVVTGLDLTEGKPGRPSRYQPVRADLLAGLPFTDAAFDFVHQRLLFLGIPVGAWPAAVREMVRVTRPGGWVELVEPRVGIENAGPAISRMLRLSLAAAAARGLDTTGAIYESLDDYLRWSGIERVYRQELSLPIGEWGGTVGSFMATDFRVAFTRLLGTLTTLSDEERRAVLQEVQAEYEERHASSSVVIAFGQKP